MQDLRMACARINPSAAHKTGDNEAESELFPGKLVGKQFGEMYYRTLFYVSWDVSETSIFKLVKNIFKFLKAI